MVPTQPGADRDAPAADDGSTDSAAAVARNIEQQALVYGAPLRDLFALVTERLGITQARVAQICGLSQPMVSQLVGARRVKIGNPVAVQRLQALIALANRAAGERLPPVEVEARLAEIASQAAVLTQSDVTSSRALPAVGAVRAVQGLFRAVASASEMLDAARAIEKEHPEIARLLRVYGAGRTQDAIDHFDAHAHLM